jgi:hypothetical protein
MKKRLLVLMILSLTIMFGSEEINNNFIGKWNPYSRSLKENGILNIDKNTLLFNNSEMDLKKEYKYKIIEKSKDVTLIELNKDIPYAGRFVILGPIKLDKNFKNEVQLEFAVYKNKPNITKVKEDLSEWGVYYK